MSPAADVENRPLGIVDLQLDGVRTVEIAVQGQVQSVIRPGAKDKGAVLLVVREVGHVEFTKDTELGWRHPQHLSAAVHNQIRLAVVVEIGAGIIVQDNVRLPDLVLSHVQMRDAHVLGLVPAEFVVLPFLRRGENAI